MSNKTSTRLISLLVSISLVVTASCTSKAPAIHTTLPQQKVQGIKVGDTVKVTTHEGEEFKFKVERLTNEEIEGEGIKIALVDIATVKKVRFTGTVIAITLVVIAMLVAIILISPGSDVQRSQRYAPESGGK